MQSVYACSYQNFIYTADSNNLHFNLWDTGSVLLDTLDVDLDNEFRPTIICLCVYIGYMKDNHRYHIKYTKTNYV